VSTPPLRPREDIGNLSWSSNRKYLTLGCGTDRDMLDEAALPPDVLEEPL